MISEKGFARGYSSFWTEYFPWLNSYCQSVNKFSLESISAPIQELDFAEHRSINNTVAFFHFKNLKRDKNVQLEQSRDEAISYMSRFPRSAIATYKFSAKDQKVIDAQLVNIRWRYAGEITINPLFAGCGILDNCFGDVLYGKVLAEIKAGDRNLQPADIKQLIVYCALDWLATSPKYSFSEVEIYNPRIGYLWKSTVDELLVSITDLPKEDVFEQIGKYLVVQSEEIEIF